MVEQSRREHFSWGDDDVTGLKIIHSQKVREAPPAADPPEEAGPDESASEDEL